MFLQLLCLALPTLILFTEAASLPQTNTSSCRCTPNETCWPSSKAWADLNETVSGKLIANTPIAISCYPGPQFDETLCAYIDQSWNNSTFQADHPLGLDYPIDPGCVPVNYTAGEVPGNCAIGSNPWFAVNATSSDDVAATINFAKDNNIRLIIKTTGHDILGRSDGYGSLEVWLRHLRNGIAFQDTYQPSRQCSEVSWVGANWTGAAIHINGSYTWNDVYPLAEANEAVVVGGGTPSVGCIGGWMQGGGHGPASREFGLGADQVLEAQVVLANGSIVTASRCENQDLLFAIRGGGPGTYGVITSTTVKAYPNVNASVQHLAIAPLSGNTSALLDAVSILYSAFPNMNDAGYAGYGTWSVASAVPLFANFTAGYVHGIYMFNRSLDAAQKAFDSARAQLQPLNGTSLFISETYVSYPDYWSFYWNESAVYPGVGASNGFLGSRVFDRPGCPLNRTALRQTIETIAGTPEQYTTNSLELVSGGQVLKDYSGVNPAWRISYFNNIVSRGWPVGANVTVQRAIQDDVTYNKLAAMRELAPQTGAYMNEADRLEPWYEEDFYGLHYGQLCPVS